MGKNNIESFFKITLIDKLSASLRKTSQKIGTAAKDTRKVSSGFAKANREVANSMKRTGRSIKSMQRELNLLEKRRSISVDTSEIHSANKRIKHLRKGISRLQSETKQPGGGKKGLALSRLARIGSGLMGGLGAAISTKAIGFAKDAETVKVAIKSLVGDAKKADTLYDNFNELANSTPFKNNEIIAAGRLLLSQGEQTEDVVKTLRTLGDVASGASTDLSGLARIYGQIKGSGGRAQLEDIQQFAERGIPIFKELGLVLRSSLDAKGKSGSEVRNLISKGAVGFEHVKLALENLTGAGGLFHEMMAEQSRTLNGQLSTLVGKLELIMVKIGTELLPLAKELVSVAIEHAEKLKGMARSLVGIIRAAMAHKTALLIIIPMWTAYFAIMLKVKLLGMVFPGLFSNIGKGVRGVSTSLPFLSRGVKITAISFRTLWTTLQANPVGAILAGITLLITGISMLYKHLTKATEAEKMLSEATKSASESIKNQLLPVKIALDKLKDTKPGTDARRKSVEAFRKEHPAYLRGLDLEQIGVSELREAYGRLTEEMKKHARMKALRNVLVKIKEKIIENELRSLDDIKKGISWPYFGDKDAKAKRIKAEEAANLMRQESDVLEKYKAAEENDLDRDIYDSSVKKERGILAPSLKIGSIKLPTSGVGTSDVIGGSTPKGLSGDVSTTVTGGRQPLHLSINIENGLNISEFNSYSEQEDEEIQEKLADVVLKAINEGARSAKLVTTHHG